MLGDRENRIAWGLIGALYLALFVVLLSNIKAANHPSYNNGDAQGEHGLPGEFIGLTATGWTAVFTLILTVATVIQIRLWIRSNRTAEAANTKSDANIELTRKSVAAMEKANEIAIKATERQARMEAGKLVFVDSIISEGSTPHFLWALRNEGGGTIIPSLISVKVGRVNEDVEDLNRSPLAFVAFIQDPVPRGQFISTGGLMNIGANRTVGGGGIRPVPLPELEDEEDIVYIEIRVTYDVVVGIGYEQVFLLSWSNSMTRALFIMNRERRLDGDGINWEPPADEYAP